MDHKEALLCPMTAKQDEGKTMPTKNMSILVCGKNSNRMNNYCVFFIKKILFKTIRVEYTLYNFTIRALGLLP